MKKKLLVSITAIILLIAVYCVIFSFSAEDGTQSGSKSEMVSRFCVQTVNKMFHCEWTEQKIAEYTKQIEMPIRKLAHFSEYAVTAVLLFILFTQWVPINKKLFFVIVVWVAVSAALDEIHQLSVPGRSGNLKDVCIDTLGGTAGLYCCILVAQTKDKRKLKRKNKAGNQS